MTKSRQDAAPTIDVDAAIRRRGFQPRLNAQVGAIDNAPVVFVGFGAHAPERQWDDDGDIDLTDKVALFLVNDPHFAAAPDEHAAGRFGNRRMTCYGRWAYKFEEAARRGAAAALVIHETEAAGLWLSVIGKNRGRTGNNLKSRFDPELVLFDRLAWKVRIVPGS